jgi:hypothetical protein
MSVQRRRGLVKVGRRCRQRHLELFDPTDVVEVDAQNLGWLTRREVERLGLWDTPAVVGH